MLVFLSWLCDSFRYSSDLRTVSFVKEGSVGLRLVGGNDVGIFVGGVQPNSSAYNRGMKEGDQIMQVRKADHVYFFFDLILSIFAFKLN